MAVQLLGLELPGHQRGAVMGMSPYASNWASSVVTA